jgi:hypothetical protein
MFHSSHAAQYCLDASTHSRALADQSYAIDPQNHDAIVIIGSEAAPPARDICMQFMRAGLRTSLAGFR